MTTPFDIIVDAYEKLGIYAPGEVLSAADSSRGLSALSDLIDHWNDDSIYLYKITSLAVDLVEGTQSYTVGPGGAVTAPSRPSKVIIGPAVGTVTFAGPTTLPIDSVSSLEWNAIYNTSQVAGVPIAFYYNAYAAFPFGLLSFSPVPNAANMTASVPAFFGLAGFTDDLSSSNVVLAPGQEQALRTNLAVLLHSYFTIGQITPDLLAEAQRSKTLLTLTNRLSRAMSSRNVAPQTPIQPRP